MTEIRGAHVVVTGGTQGLGAAICGIARSHGAASVTAIARRTPEEAGETPLPGVRYLQADVTDPEAVQRVLGRDGLPCDVLFCCAGRALPGLFGEVPLAEYGDQLRLNLLGAINTVSAVLPGMRERGSGHIVLTSSTAGLLGVIGYSGYCASKWALRGFAESLRYEVEPDGIRVALLYPPDMDTPGFAVENTRKPIETVAVSGAIAPMSPQRVARAALKGVRRNRPHIAADAATRLLVRGGGIVDLVARPIFARTIRRARA